MNFVERRVASVRFLPSSFGIDVGSTSARDGIAFDPQGNIVVINIGNNDVLTFALDGKLLKTEKAVQAGNDGLVVMPDGTKYVSSVQRGTISRIRPGQAVAVTSAAGAVLSGRVRMIAPTVDLQTRNALVYVDLPPGSMRNGFKAGMFARGEFATGSSGAMTLPLAAIALRDGFAWLFTVGSDNRVAQMKVQIGRRAGDRVEVQTRIGHFKGVLGDPAHPPVFGTEVTVSIRPECWTLATEKQGENVLPGRIGESVYLGEVAQHAFVCGDTTLKIFELNPRFAAQAGRGQVFATVRPEDVVVLAE